MSAIVSHNKAQGCNFGFGLWENMNNISTHQSFGRFEMKAKRVLAVSMTAVMTAGMVTGCGNTATQATTDTVKTEANSVVEVENNQNTVEETVYLDGCTKVQ